MGTDETPNKAPVGAPGPPRPFWLVWLILFGLVVVLLGGAFLLDARLRPQVGTEPPATTASVAFAQATSLPEPITPTVSASPTLAAGGQAANGDLGQEVSQAYLHYWDVYAQAMFTLDPSQLHTVANGDRLNEALAEVADLKAQGKAAKIQVDHHFFVFDVTATSASVHDEYDNKSYTIDPRTRAPLGSPGTTQHLVDTYFLQRVDGEWKVVRGLRESP